MRKNVIKLLLMLLVGSSIMTSCLGDSDDSSTSDDAYISALSLGTLKRNMTKKTSSGEDSSYVGALSTTAFPLTIDQVNGKIFNADSLPIGTRIDKVVFSTLSAYGYVYIVSLSSGNDTTFSTTDSTDFTVPRTFNVYSASGKTKKTYEVTISARQTAPDSVSWTKVDSANTTLAALSSAKLFTNSSNLLLFGNNGSPVLLTSSISDGRTWSTSQLSGASGIDISSIVYFSGVYYAMSGSNIITSSDGISWNTLSTSFSPELIFAAGSRALYAKSGSTIYTSVDGSTWAVDSVLNASYLPTAGVVSASYPSATNVTLSNVISLGLTGTTTSIWSKVEDLTGVLSFPWNRVVSDYASEYRSLPNPLTNAALTVCNSRLLAIGFTADTLSSLYSSTDGGLTWRGDTIYLRPTMSQTPTAVGMATTADNHVWIVTGGTGEVIKGRLNSLATKE